MKIGFVKNNKFANISHKIVFKDIYNYCNKYFDTVWLSGRYHQTRTLYNSALEKKNDYIFVDDFINPHFFKYRERHNININFLMWPHVFEPWKDQYKKITPYLKEKDVMIVFSKLLERSFAYLSSEFNIFSMPVPIDTSLYKPSKKKHKDILNLVYCGRILPNKGLGILIEALSRLPKPKKFKLYIIGETTNENYVIKNDNLNLSYLKNIKVLIEKYNFEKNVIFCGGLADNQAGKRKIFSQSDVLVYLSTYPGETFGRVIVEAFAAGMAVITTKWLALDELVVNDKNGYKVEVGKNGKIRINDVIDKINKLYNKKQLSTIQKNNREKAKVYDYHVQMARLKKKLNVKTELIT